MNLLIAAMLLFAQDASAPDSFAFHIVDREGKPVADELQSYTVGTLKFNLLIMALDKDGQLLDSFQKSVKIYGLEGITETKPFESGVLTLVDVQRSLGPIEIRYQGKTSHSKILGLYGWLCLLPPLLAIVLAIWTRQILIALLAGIWSGFLFVYGFAPITTLLRVIDTHIINELADKDHLAIIVFTLALGGMIGIISRSGGTRALVESLSHYARSRRSGMITTVLMGIVIFFDDYANCLLVGNSIRPLSDKMKISREKLSFLIDSTAAPIAGILIFSTWIGFEIGLIGDVLMDAGKDPGTAYAVFMQTLPYRFYNILLILFVIAVAVTGKDFGPMLRAERRAFREGKVLRDGATPLADTSLTESGVIHKSSHWSLAVIPILGTIFILVLGLYLTGVNSLDEGQEASLSNILGKSNPYGTLIYAAFGGGLIALLMTCFGGSLKLSETVTSWVTGCQSMMMALLILTLAWTLGTLCKQYLHVGDWLVSLISPPPAMMPFLIFAISCAVAFATGTSFGTMGLVFPIAGALVYNQLLEVDGAIQLATLSSVMSGAVFGDHCSPISDTTIMSSMGAAADHVDHVRTQSPYAITVAMVAGAVGYIPAGFGFSPWISLALGTAVLIGLLLFFGKNPEAKA